METNELVSGGLLSVSDAATWTGISRSSLYGLMASGDLAYTKIRGRRLIPRRALEQLAERGLVPARSAAR